MWMILKTFNLSKNTLIYLFYLIIIVTIFSNQIDSVTIQTEEELDNEAEENIQSKKDSVLSDKNQNKKFDSIQEIFNRMKNRNKNTETSKNEINNNDLKENEHVTDKIEDQKSDEEENPLNSILIGLDSESTAKELEHEHVTDKIENQKSDEEENPLNQIQIGLDSESTDKELKEIKEKKKKKKKKKPKIIQEEENTENVTEAEPITIVNESDTVDSKTAQISDPEKNSTKDMQIDYNDLTPSLLEDMDIVKIKQNLTESSENIRKENKKKTFKEFENSKENARIYCTFLGDVLKMYKKVKKRFIGHFCHAIVIGTPIKLHLQQVHINQKTKNHLIKIKEHKDKSLLIVVMQYSSYKEWVNELQDTTTLVQSIINTVLLYKIDGIQFSNLHPTMAEYQIDEQMFTNLITFFKTLIDDLSKKDYDLKIGITMNMYSQSFATSFISFENLNEMVTWYSFHTISMVTCSSDYKTTGTSPLEGEVGLNTTIQKLIDNEFDMSKLVVGIQLYPNKVNDKLPLTYEKLCSTSKNSWDEWCAAKPKNLWLKGKFLREIKIGGVQLFYMHSDDYRSTCKCHSFPLIRAFLSGLINRKPETCEFLT